MKSNYLKNAASFFAVLVMTWAISCSGKTGKVAPAAPEEDQRKARESTQKLIRMTSPSENDDFKAGEQIKVILETADKNIIPDSVTVTFNGRKVVTIKSAPWQCSIERSLTGSTGRKSVKATAYSQGKQATVISRFVIIMSDTPPKIYKYKVVNTFPHDKDAFTQGLFYYEGMLYEGTGQTGQSTLREVEPQTGRIKRQLNLSSSLFGEGITLYKDRIYQVTWEDKVGFVYDRATFNQLNKIYYQTQGWGLTTMNDRIVLSDGSNILYIYEPEMFTVVSQLEVYDNEKKVDQLNELEYINGEIWANIWMTDRIARIDPVSGKVLGYIDLKGILKDPDTDTNVNVLNGIAWDKDGNRIFVTGKNWPKLFEIRITE